MLARFFVDRPIFAWVIAIVIMLAGALSITALPIAQYADVAPPTVTISANYPGASAETVENSVTQLLEEQLTGIDGLLYFSSSSDSSGNVSIQITFEQSVNPDTAQVQVQNRVQQATARLPMEVQQRGVTVAKASEANVLMIVGVYDETGRSSSHEIADYLVSNLQEPVARQDGVGSVAVFGAQHAIRIWLDPTKLAAYSLAASDVISAIEAQNVQMSAGRIGGTPEPPGQQLSATVRAQSKLTTPDEFLQIILKRDTSGAAVQLGDVARVELGSESYDFQSRLNGHPGAALSVRLASGANALATARTVRAVVAQLQQSMPTGYKILYPKDITPFIEISIEEVIKTLFEAIVLVIVVMYVFLQNWRATLVPAIAVPVVLLGTFGVLAVLGYSINTLTMSGMVLSIGLLVDDAIVVIENVERVMHSEGCSPREATLKSMREITGALIGVATSLAAVFIPMAFFSGSTGVIYRQFSVTIVASMALSVVVALTLTPALCATLLKPSRGQRSGGFFAWFNGMFDRLSTSHEAGVARIIKRPLRWMVSYVLIIAILAVAFLRLPSSFVPDEDKGELLVTFNLPSGATMSRTAEVTKQIEAYFLNQEKDNVETIMSVNGFSFSGRGPNAGIIFIALKDWSQRSGYENSADAIVQRAGQALSSIRDARVFALNPPAIQGIGQMGGFEFQLQATGGTSRQTLGSNRDILLSRARADQKLMAVRIASLDDTPQLQVDIDQRKASSLGLSLADVNSTLNAAWGGIYVNDFIDRGRVKRVYLQGDANFRSSPDDLNKWYVRGDDGAMTPFAAFATTRWTHGPETLSRFNGLPSYTIQGSAAPGVSSGTAMSEMDSLTSQLPPGTAGTFSGQSYQERLASGQTMKLYAISILVVFLCLAALYESWAVPLSVLLVIPLGVLGSVLATELRGLENNIYFQVALLATMGLSAKNAILIIEFAEESYRQGSELVSAAVRAARLRLRPILMTSVAFMAGVMPLAFSTGAGANARVSIGTGILGGTLLATALAIFFVPLFFVLVRSLFPRPVAEPSQPGTTEGMRHA